MYAAIVGTYDDDLNYSYSHYNGEPLHYNGGRPLHFNHGRPRSNDKQYIKTCSQCNKAYSGVQLSFTDKNLSINLTSRLSIIFTIGEMAGISMLITPWGVANFGLTGIVMFAIFAAASVYCTECLEACWLILEERRPVEKTIFPQCDPHLKLARYIFGIQMRRYVMWCIRITLFCAAAICMMLIAQCAERLISDQSHGVTLHTWLYVFSILLSSVMVIENPKRIRFVAGGSLITAIVATFFMLMQITFDSRLSEGTNVPQAPILQTDPVKMSLAIGTLLFSTGATSLLPTLQNSVFKQIILTRGLLIFFGILAVLFGCVLIGGYFVYGANIQPNILLSMGDSWWANIAIIMTLCHLCFTFLIYTAPLTRHFEMWLTSNNDLSSVMTSYVEPHFQRYFFCVGLLLTMITADLIISDFSCLVALIGCSTMVVGAFILPLVFYLRLCRPISYFERNNDWIDRSLDWKQKSIIYGIITVASVGGIASVSAAIFKIVEGIIPYVVDFIGHLSIPDFIKEYFN